MLKKEEYYSSYLEPFDLTIKSYAYNIVDALINWLT